MHVLHASGRHPRWEGPQILQRAGVRGGLVFSLMLSPPSMACHSLSASVWPQPSSPTPPNSPSSPTLLCKAIQGLLFLSSVIFLAGLLVLSLEDVCYLSCSLEAAHKETWKRKKNIKIIYTCRVAQAEVVTGVKISLCSVLVHQCECVICGTVARDANKTNKQHLSNLSSDPELWCTSWRVISLEMFSFCLLAKSFHWAAPGRLPPRCSRHGAELRMSACGAEDGEPLCQTPEGAQWALSSRTASSVNVWGSWAIPLHRHRSVAEPWFSTYIG